MDQDTRRRIADGSACLEAALRYLSLGISVLPLCPPDHVGVAHVRHRCDNWGKVPWVAWKKYQEQRPTAAEVRLWWEQLPNSNVGCALGPASGLVRVDAEGEGGAAALVRKSGGDLPPTWEFRSGRADGTGHGWLYRIPEGADLRTTYESTGSRQEVRFQARGAQTVLPPSRHKDGGLYEWLTGRSPHDGPPAPMPVWLLHELAPRPNVGRGRSVAEWEVLLGGVPEGRRNVSAAEYAGLLFASLRDPEDPVQVRLVWDTFASWNERNDPPLSDRELKGVFVSIQGREVEQRRAADANSLERYVATTIQASGDEADNRTAKAPPDANGFDPAWHLVTTWRQDPGPEFLLRSPLWSFSPRVRPGGGYVELTANEVVTWQGLIRPVFSQTGIRLDDKMRGWAAFLRQLRDQGEEREAPLETKRPLQVAAFLWEHLRGARPAALDDDGAVRYTAGSPLVLPDPDGRIVVKLDWLAQVAGFRPDPFKQKELLKAMTTAGMEKDLLGPDNKRSRWWTIRPGCLRRLEAIILETGSPSRNGHLCANDSAQNHEGAQGQTNAPQ